MKVLAFVLLVALVEASTVTEDLVEAQGELTIGHEFTELYLTQNRERLSEYLASMESEILEAFMVAYAEIKNTAIDTREIMEEYNETSVCEDSVRARWELQINRYGQRLSQCLGVANGYLQDFTSNLNELHEESRAYSNVIPNAGLNVLSTLDIFDGRDNLQTYINNGFRDLFFRSLEFQEDFGDYIDMISWLRDSYVYQLTACFRSLPNTFEAESVQDLESIRLCSSD